MVDYKLITLSNEKLQPYDSHKEVRATNYSYIHKTTALTILWRQGFGVGYDGNNDDFSMGQN